MVYIHTYFSHTHTHIYIYNSCGEYYNIICLYFQIKRLLNQILHFIYIILNFCTHIKLSIMK